MAKPLSPLTAPIEQVRKTILVLAYSISPVRGSEYAVGWDYVTHMSEDHDLIVLYGLAGDHMGDLEEIDEETKRSFGDRVTFAPVRPGFMAQLLNAPNRAGRFVYLFYLAYRFWHRQALYEAEQICRERHIDLVHYLCPIGFREPGFLWRLNKPYIWGPVGGMPPYKWRLFAHAGKICAAKTFLRNIANWLQVYCTPRLRVALDRTDVLLAATSENAVMMRTLAAVDPVFLPENGIRTIYPTVAHDSANGELRLIWVGRIDARKALVFALSALARLKGKNWQLAVVGSGPLEESMRRLAQQLAISDRVTWYSRVPREQVLSLFKEADVHVLSSLAEAHSTVLWEAMANGVPTVAFDHCGMHDSICDQCGVRVPVSTRDQMVADLAETLEQLVADRAKVERLKRGTAFCAQQNSWTIRRKTWNRLYELAIERYAARNDG